MERSRGNKRTKRTRKKPKSQNLSPTKANGRKCSFDATESPSRSSQQNSYGQYSTVSNREPIPSFYENSPNYIKPSSSRREQSTSLQERSPRSRKSSPFKSNYASTIFPCDQGPLSSYYQNIRTTGYPLFNNHKHQAPDYQCSQHQQFQLKQDPGYRQSWHPNPLGAEIWNSPQRFAFGECPQQNRQLQANGSGSCYSCQEVSMYYQATCDEPQMNVIRCCRRQEKNTGCPCVQGCCQVNEDCQYFLIQSQPQGNPIMVDKCTQYEEEGLERITREERGHGCMKPSIHTSEPALKKPSVHYESSALDQVQGQSRPFGEGYTYMGPVPSSQSYVGNMPQQRVISCQQCHQNFQIGPIERQEDTSAMQPVCFQNYERSPIVHEEMYAMPPIVFQGPDLPPLPAGPPCQCSPQNFTSPLISGQKACESGGEDHKDKKTRVCRTNDEGGYSCDWELRPEMPAAVDNDDTVWVIKTSSNGEIQKIPVALNKQKAEIETSPKTVNDQSKKSVQSNRSSNAKTTSKDTL